jgi:hypothetical protein
MWGNKCVAQFMIGHTFSLEKHHLHWRQTYLPLVNKSYHWPHREDDYQWLCTNVTRLSCCTQQPRHQYEGVTTILKPQNIPNFTNDYWKYMLMHMLESVSF